MDWLTAWKLLKAVQTARRVCPQAKLWLSPMIDTFIMRAPYPVQYIIATVAARRPVDGILVFGGNWFIDPQERLFSTVGSFVRTFPVETTAGGCNRLAGLRSGTGRRLLSAGFNSVICGVSQQDDLDELRRHLAELASLVPWRPFGEIEL